MTDKNGSHTYQPRPNSKPIFLKRLICTGFDVVSLFLVFMALTYVITRTPLAAEYNRHVDSYKEIEKTVLEQVGNDLVKARERLSTDQAYRDEMFAANLHGYLLKALAAAIAEAVLFLIIPLSDPARGTIGRRLTGIALFDESRQSYARWYQVLGRFVFIFVFESMTLYLWTGILTFLLVPVLRLIMVMLNRKDKTLCDYRTFTMLIEKTSYSSIH